MRLAKNRSRGRPARGAGASADAAARQAAHDEGRDAWRARQHARHERRFRDPRRGPGLGKRLLIIYVVASVLSIAVSGLAMKWVFDWHRQAGVLHGLHEQSDAIVHRLRFDAQGRPVAFAAAQQADWVYAAAPRDWKFRVLDERGVAMLSSDVGAGALVPAGAVFAPGRVEFDVVDGNVVLHVATQASVHDGHPFYVQTAVSERAAALASDVAVGPVIKSAMGIAIVSLALFVIGMHFALGYLLRPLREASEAASRIDPRNFAARLSLTRTPRELRPLMAAFNAALDRLEKGYRTQQDFLAAAAHELKTPLALMRGQVELSDSADRDTLLHDIDLMSRQVHQLLHLAEVSEATNYVFAEVDAMGVAGEAIAFLQRLAQRAGVHLDLRPVAASGVPVRADRGALFVLVKNLVENAIQHSPRGAVVAIVVDETGIVVRDEGAGIAPEHLARLFTRFWRGPARRDSGAGLGLSICQEIALAHRWAIEARNGDVGAEFRVSFDAD